MPKDLWKNYGITSELFWKNFENLKGNIGKMRINYSGSPYGILENRIMFGKVSKNFVKKFLKNLLVISGSSKGFRKKL